MIFISKGWQDMPKPKRTNWVEIDRSLCEAYGWTPQQIDDMTLPEIRVACGGGGMTDGERMWHNNDVKRMTPEDMLLSMQIAAQGY